MSESLMLWLLTYLVHSTLLLSAVYLLERARATLASAAGRGGGDS